MPSVLVVGTNTYVTRAEATTYLGDALGSESWAFLSPDDQDKALLTAFKLLERQLWQGDAVGAVDWPRTDVIDCAGDPVSSASVPQDIKSAQIELAYAISVDNTLASKTTTEDNTKRLQAGSASIEFFNNGTLDPFGAGRFPSNVMELIRCYLEGAGGSATSAESFGTECPTDLDPSRYDFNQPQ